MVIAIIFVENQPGIDVGDVAGDINFLSEDENLWEVIHSIVGFVSDIDITIDCEGAIDEHGEGIHELLTSGIAPRDEIAAAIKLIEIGGAIHGAEAGVSLVIELGETEIILRGGFIGSEAGDSIRGISDDGVAETSFETGENGGADTGDAGFARGIFAISDSDWTDIIDT